MLVELHRLEKLEGALIVVAALASVVDFIVKFGASATVTNPLLRK